ncbi:hypothetical protein EV426DRAFT_590297 [Tirmania nivea]|nr:hypothetical protein EV426DRAFT_590297 [Tirmania nivea]
MKQCLLAMKDMRGNNGQGMVYGFVTTGEDWRMLSYDGTNFRMTRKFNAMFDGMEEDKVRWMKDYSILIECMLFALSDGGFVKENVVVGEEKVSSLSFIFGCSIAVADEGYYRMKESEVSGDMDRRFGFFSKVFICIGTRDVINEWEKDFGTLSGGKE